MKEESKELYKEIELFDFDPFNFSISRKHIFS